MRIHALGARALFLAVVAVAIAVPLQPPQATVAADPASTVIANARHHLGAPWRYGADGPYAFDCSGLVLHAFRDAGLYARVGSGRYRSAYALYSWFRSRGLASSGGGRVGDIVVYGGGRHVGIYMGDGKVISTLVSGVRIHGLYAVTSGFTAFLHTGLSGSLPRTSKATGIRYTTRPTGLRRGPGFGYGTIQDLAPDRFLSVYGSGHDAEGLLWYYVRISNGRFGWVYGAFTRT
jgi:cell wall-associated NlpC family hydrolase